MDNFSKIMSNKFINILNNLDSENMQLDEINILDGSENEEKK